MAEAILLVVLFPLLGFLIIALAGEALSEQAAAIVACAAVGLAFIAALITLPYALQIHEPPLKSAFQYQWTAAGNWSVRFGLLADGLSAWMSLIVTGVGFLIHVYSIGYMKGEHDYRRFFAYLNLFVFTMLLLVTADNFVLMLLGWGGVGLSSFLLIGFYKEKNSAIQASRKALVMNTIGDVGLMLGIFVLLANTGSIQFNEVFGKLLNDLPNNTSAFDWHDAAGLLLLIAAVAKSAQLPLHTWLPDAMEGPTPVSALIHAATMVTAGVYLVTRAHPLYLQAETASTVVLIIGVASAFYAATCAISQTDLKRVLAYSTMSQLGYMFIAAGVGAYEAAIFHLMTHAFFKALLFLSAGAVIHALDGEQDIRNMGGLRRQMPLAANTFLVGSLAISGIPPLAGFFSKEAILGSFPLFGDEKHASTASNLALGGQQLIGWVGILVALMTAFYMFRAYFLTFEGPGTDKHAHANPAVMNLPLIVLAILSVIGGFVVVPGAYSLIEPWFRNVHELGTPSSSVMLAWRSTEPEAVDWPALAVAVIAGIAGIAIAFALFGRRVQRAVVQPVTGLANFLLKGWQFDMLYYYLFVAPTKWVANLLTKEADKDAAEALDWGFGGSVWVSSKGLRKTETGYVRNYALGILLGAVGILVYAAVLGLRR